MSLINSVLEFFLPFLIIGVIIYFIKETLFSGNESNKKVIKIDERNSINVTEQSKQIYLSLADICKLKGPGTAKKLYLSNRYMINKCLGKIIGIHEDSYMTVFLVLTNPFSLYRHRLVFTYDEEFLNTREIIINSDTLYTIRLKQILGCVKIGKEKEDMERYNKYMDLLSSSLLNTNNIDGRHMNILQAYNSQWGQETSRQMIQKAIKETSKERDDDYEIKD